MDGYIVIGTELDTKDFDAQIDYIKSQMEEIEQNLKKADMGFEVGDTLKMEAQYEKLSNRLKDLIKKKEEFNQKKMLDFSSVQSSIDNVGKSVTKVTRRIAKMALAVFSIRSAFMFVRNSINTITGDDAQLKADIDYIKNALAYTLEPIVRGIVNLAKQLLYYIQYIVKAWTGKNIFANANKSLEKANKQAKELKKTTTAFDEMSTLNDSSNGSGGVSPSFDLTSPENVPIPAWVQFIVDNKDNILATIGGISSGILAIKFGLKGIKALGIGLIIFGIIKAISGLLDYLKDPSWDNFGDIIQGIGIAILGLAVVFGSVPLAIAGAVTVILGLLAKFWDKIEAFLDDLQNNIFDIGDKIMDWINKNLGIIGVLINTVIGAAIGAITSTIDIIKSVLGGLFSFVKDILDSVILLFKGDFKGALSTILRGIGNLFIDVINTVISALNLITSPIRGLIVAVGKITGNNWTMENIKIPKIPRLAKGTILNNPGKGVPVAGGTAVAGEAGREAYLPLSDTQLLEELGSTIGKYIVINLTNVNQMNGRVISRELKKIQSDMSFARNE